MNMDEVSGYMNLAVEELSMAQILYDAGKYRGSVTHSYYAMFDAAKHCYYHMILLAKNMILY